jgi:hypothetical protein
MKGVIPWLCRWARCAGTRDFCSALAALVSPVQNILSSPYTISLHFVPTVQQAGQAVVPRRLSPNMCLMMTPYFSLGSIPRISM